MSIFAELLRHHRRDAGLTQEQLAERSGVSDRTIRSLENGARTVPRLTSVRLLAAALELEPDNARAFLAASQGEAAALARTRDHDGPSSRWYLPYDIPDFTGREGELGELLDRAGRCDGSTVAMAAIDGMAGVGKTALALRAAHLLADRYPDGQLFLDLHGFTPGRRPVEPAAALESLLRMAHVPEAAIPDDPDHRAALWRSTLAGRRVLVLLDNAADAAQVRALLPGAPGCLVLITSRRRMPQLPGVVPLSLDVPSTEQAAALFAAISGVGADGTDAVAEIVSLCGRLPLAVRAASTRLAHRSPWTPAYLAARMRAEDRMPAESRAFVDQAVAAALATSTARLDDARRRMLRLLGCHPGADFGPRAAGALADIPPAAADRALESLVDCHLLLSTTPGRYAFHPLVRRHARQLSHTEDTPEARRAALNRLLEHQLHTAAAAVRLITPHDRGIPPVRPASTAPADLPDEAAAVAWMTLELPNLLAGALGAAAGELSEPASTLSRALRRWLDANIPGAAETARPRTAGPQAAPAGDGLPCVLTAARTALDRQSLTLLRGVPSGGREQTRPPGAAGRRTVGAGSS
ncbi:helix-turn-helix domain-containing protein [Kitasatospora sp. NPDC057512]|uniref:helix-turn-helix domain-containing protein n=1 Tax=Kitasatospora sp. NPDC057512 TaxID=3346154 RepID=UPI00368E8735